MKGALGLLFTAYSFAEENEHSWEEQCTHIDAIETLRRIPLLSDQVKKQNPELINVQALFRHGARTRRKSGDYCWKGYSTRWDCGSVEAVSISSGSPLSHNIVYGGEFFARGACKLGGLLPVGAEQHQEMGRMIAEAYFSENSPHAVTGHPLLHLNDTKDLSAVYVRSTDFQRTILSATNFLGGMLKAIQSDPTFLRAASAFVSLHIPASKDILIPDWSKGLVHDAITEAEESDDFRRLQDENTPFRKDLSEKLGVNMEGPEWSEDAIDCFLTTACHKDLRDGLPAALKDSKTAQEMFNRAEKEATFMYHYKNGKMSKLLAMEPIRQIRDRLMLAVCPSCVNAEDFVAIANEYGYEGSLLTDSSASNGDREKKLFLYSAHDTTLMPLLVGLGVYDERWPPYASLLALEVYTLPESTSAVFRLVYNGQDITHRFDGCVKDTLCHTRAFFEATSWAVQAKVPLRSNEAYLSDSVWLPEYSYLNMYTLLSVTLFGIAGLVARYAFCKASGYKHYERLA